MFRSTNISLKKMPEKYKIVIERRAQKDLDKLQRNIFLLIASKIRSLEIEPRPAGTKKLKTQYGDFRLRIGDYRILYEISDTERIIKVFRVKHRKDVYRNM